jgi:CBS domain-containing protein
MGAVKTGMKAADVMMADPVTVTPSMNIREFARVLEENEISGTPVVDQQGTLVAVASKTDLVRQCVQGTIDLPPGYLFDLVGEQDMVESAADTLPDPPVNVQDFMTEGPVTVSPDAPLGAIARARTEAHVHRVVVVDPERYPVGIITTLDLLEHWPG